jgi:alpha-mannosidase/mannosylglycerate hydrolase
VRLGVLLGADADDEFRLAEAAARHRTGTWATQLRSDDQAASAFLRPAAPRVRGALVSALKPAEAGEGLVLRVTNPTGEPRVASVELPETVLEVREVRLDESAQPGPVDHDGAPSTEGRMVAVAMPPYGVRTLHLSTSD